MIAVLPPHGRVVLIEVKTGSAKPRPDQRAFLDRWEAAGALGVLVYDAVALDEWLVAKLAAERGRKP